jgi:hypothetical protein
MKIEIEREDKKFVFEINDDYFGEYNIISEKDTKIIEYYYKQIERGMK